MKKIAFIIRDLNFGGAQRQLVTLAKGLDRQGFDVSILYFYPGGPLEKDLKDTNISVICLEKRGRWHLFSFFWSLIWHLKQIRPHVLHGYLAESNLIAILLKPFLPATKIIWGIRESKGNLQDYDWLSKLIFRLENFLSHLTDLIIVNSYAGQAYYLTHQVSADKMLVISNGIDTERFQPDREAGAKVRAEWGISQNTILIGLVGRINPIKDHPTFLKTAALLAEERTDVRFVCVGVGSETYTRELYQLTKELNISDKVLWTGGRADMSAVHNALNIAVSSSCYTEGFSNVIGEAMACGVPCVVTDVGDSAWIVGDRGIVVPPKNPKALKNGMKKLIENLGTNNFNGAHIRQRIVEHFSVQQLVLKTEAALLSLFCNPISKAEKRVNNTFLSR
ncbi:glycosyltransferase [Nostocaceae cyanobacterium CENA369]|uniref:Glycosyltransferase n=1 Tax=Dendronalium phyllosphericum CENA369 TaxID=1725256 RepID=A0A8J7I199_9NOST|nr:glycosyltransferase [Dendronalium phyllosphericum]MBH8571658.1 glycosyltransferase [Dendronalium phyllosphericum CENA369]